MVPEDQLESTKAVNKAKRREKNTANILNETDCINYRKTISLFVCLLFQSYTDNRTG